jgi:tRNA G18 (ribose-2'-O)-methylase SpoU
MIKKLKKQGFEIIALEQTPKSEILFEMDFKNPNIALVLGNEVEGISPETLKHCDRHAEIPMYGQKSSLNVAIAAGIAMYEIHEKMI